MEHQFFRILIADDDAEDLELTEAALLKANPNLVIQTVSNGKSVIDHLVENVNGDLPHLIILDYNMPELNGPEVLAVICTDKRFSSISVIMLSTSSSSLHVKECTDKGAAHYFIKPNTMHGLNRVAEKILALGK